MSESELSSRERLVQALEALVEQGTWHTVPAILGQLLRDGTPMSEPVVRDILFDLLDSGRVARRWDYPPGLSRRFVYTIPANERKRK